MPRFIQAAFLAVLATLALTPAAAVAQGTVSLGGPSFLAHENQGVLAITINRTQTDRSGWIYYGVHRQDALRGLDFWPVPGTQIHFEAGQSSVSFNVHIIDNGINSTPVHAMAYLYGSDSANAIGTGKAQVTILRDDPLDQRDPLNPLGVPTLPNGAVPNGNVLFHTPFYAAGDESPAGRARAHTADRGAAQALAVIANEPLTKRFWFWNTPADPTALVTHYLGRAEHHEPGTAVKLSTYSVVHGHCDQRWSDSPGLVARYQHWIDALANGIGNYHVVMFFELDSLITAGCLSPHGLQVQTPGPPTHCPGGGRHRCCAGPASIGRRGSR
jgi:hypothetical protein